MRFLTKPSTLCYTIPMKDKHKRLLYWLLFAVYILAVLYITLISRTPTYPRHNFHPFWEYELLLAGNQQRYYFQQVGCNILMLIPFGAFLEHRLHWKVIPLGGLFSIAIELTQYFTARGLCEFDDVFNNTLGCVIGVLVVKEFRAVRSWMKQRESD